MVDFGDMDEATQSVINVRLGLNGRVVIPARARHSLHIKEGDSLLLTVDEASGRLILETEEAVVKRLRALVGPPPGGERGERRAHPRATRGGGARGRRAGRVTLT